MVFSVRLYRTRFDILGETPNIMMSGSEACVTLSVTQDDSSPAVRSVVTPQENYVIYYVYIIKIYEMTP